MKNQEVLISEASVRNWLNQTVGQKCWTCFHGDHKCRNREEINMYCVALFPLWGCSCSHCMFFFLLNLNGSLNIKTKLPCCLLVPKPFLPSIVAPHDLAHFSPRHSVLTIYSHAPYVWKRKQSPQCSLHVLQGSLFYFTDFAKNYETIFCHTLTHWFLHLTLQSF